MRILRRLRQNHDLNLVAANLSRERTEIRQGSDDVEFCLAAESAAKNYRED